MRKILLCFMFIFLLCPVFAKADSWKPLPGDNSKHYKIAGETTKIQPHTFAQKGNMLVCSKCGFQKKGKLKKVKKKATGPKALIVDYQGDDSARVSKYLKKAGFQVYYIRTLKKAKKCKVKNYDCLVIPGGHNITPSVYGEKRWSETYGTDLTKDKMQIAVIKKFVKAKKPILGICRGQQILNVALGGTIIQHLPKSGWHKNNRTIKIKKNSWLYGTYGGSESVYHSHHQAVKKLGKGLVATAWDKAEPDIIEGIEHKNLPIYGVQWHPDHMEKGTKVFTLFKKTVKNYKKTGNKKAVNTKKAKPALNKKKATIYVGKKVQLKLLNSKAKKLTWKSSNKKIATVSKKGLVKGKKKGKATISVKTKKKTFKCVVTVKTLPAKKKTVKTVKKTTSTPPVKVPTEEEINEIIERIAEEAKEKAMEKFDEEIEAGKTPEEAQESADQVIYDAQSRIDKVLEDARKKQAALKKSQKKGGKKGSKYTVSNRIYKVTSAKTVTFMKPKKKTFKSCKIPAKVKIRGKVYRVNAVAASAFRNNKKLKRVVIPASVKKIGANAFYKTPSLKKVTIRSKKLSIGADAFYKTGKQCKVYVPKARKKAFSKLLARRGLKKKQVRKIS